MERFISLLPTQYKQQWRSVFSSKKQNNKSHQLIINNQQAFDDLFAASIPTNNRIEASERGDSHKEKTSFSFLLLFHQALYLNKNEISNISPEVVVINNDGLQQGFRSKNNLLIIENQENFFCWSQFLSTLTLFCQHSILAPMVALADVDIAFGSGNNITNSKNIAFFKQYKNIMCSFDYDLGGLIMFKSLKKLCVNTSLIKNETINLSFVLPDPDYLTNTLFTAQYFKNPPKDSKQWQQAIKLANELGFNELAQAFNKTKKFMEQESYLSAPFNTQG